MPVFDRYLIVDWSANNVPKTGSDSIWLSQVERGDAVSTLCNIATRAAAMDEIFRHVRDALAVGKRLFVGFDFAFGFPRGAARVMAGSADWQAVWSKLSKLIGDGDDNASNRFEVGGQLNQLFDKRIREKPFWGHPHQHKGRYPGLEAHKPDYEILPEKRLVDHEMQSAQPVWKLAYTGSVGSQTLLGIPRLENLRGLLGDKLQIWPFETRFAEQILSPVTVAEIYPSMLPVKVAAGEVKDAAQVRTMAKTFAALDASDCFRMLLSKPDCLSNREREIVLAEEGWMVGAGHKFDAGRNLQ